MGCTSCHQSNPTPTAVAREWPPLVMRATLMKKVISSVDGKPYSLNQPLVPVLYYPRGEWAVQLTIAGFDRVIDKPSAPEVFNEAMRLFLLNEEPFWFINIWLNLNLQWVAKVAPKYQIVTVTDLESISQPV